MLNSKVIQYTVYLIIIVKSDEGGQILALITIEIRKELVKIIFYIIPVKFKLLCENRKENILKMGHWNLHIILIKT